jgi:hypothetical protein
MESVVSWAAERGHRIEPYGLDISAELAALARERLPQWAQCIFTGNAAEWEPPLRFDYVRTGLEYAPPAGRHRLIGHLMSVAVAPAGRLIIGPYPEHEQIEVERAIRHAGSGAAGTTSAADGERTRRVTWIDTEPL